VWDAIDPARYAGAGTFTVRGIAQDASRMPVEATVVVEAPPAVELAVDTRCVAGKVVEAARVTNITGAPVAVSVTTPHGTRTTTVGPDRTTSLTWSTGVAAVGSGEVAAEVAGTGAVSAQYPARSCA